MYHVYKHINRQKNKNIKSKQGWEEDIYNKENKKIIYIIRKVGKYITKEIFLNFKNVIIKIFQIVFVSADIVHVFKYFHVSVCNIKLFLI